MADNFSIFVFRLLIPEEEKILKNLYKKGSLGCSVSVYAFQGRSKHYKRYFQMHNYHCLKVFKSTVKRYGGPYFAHKKIRPNKQTYYNAL